MYNHQWGRRNGTRPYMRVDYTSNNCLEAKVTSCTYVTSHVEKIMVKVYFDSWKEHYEQSYNAVHTNVWWNDQFSNEIRFYFILFVQVIPGIFLFHIYNFEQCEMLFTISEIVILKYWLKWKCLLPMANTVLSYARTESTILDHFVTSPVKSFSRYLGFTSTDASI